MRFWHRFGESHFADFLTGCATSGHPLLAVAARDISAKVSLGPTARVVELRERRRRRRRRTGAILREIVVCLPESQQSRSNLIAPHTLPTPHTTGTPSEDTMDSATEAV